jgi:hypothetical protein
MMGKHEYKADGLRPDGTPLLNDNPPDHDKVAEEIFEWLFENFNIFPKIRGGISPDIIMTIQKILSRR